MKLRSKIFTKKNTSIFVLIAISVVLLIIARLLARTQNIEQEAAGTARLFFTPNSALLSPLQKNVNDTFTLDLMLDPGQALVSFIRFDILYDETKLSVQNNNSVQVNTTAFPAVLEGPQLDPGKIAASVSVGSDPTRAIIAQTKIATITFKALANTGGPIQVRLGDAAQVLSIDPNASATDNVLQTITPAFVLVGPGGTITLAPTNAASPTPPLTGSISPTAGNLSPTGINATPTQGTNITPTQAPPVASCTVNLKFTQNVYDMTAVGQEVWITTTDGIARFKPNGTQIDPIITGNGLNSPSGITLVDNQVWVVNRFNKMISRFNTDGTPAGTPLTLSGSQIPPNVRLTGIETVGQEVWISDEENARIYVIDKTGLLITAPITHISIDSPASMTTIGQEVWVMNSNYHNRINTVADIVRLNMAGAYRGSIDNTGRLPDEIPVDLMTVNSEVWYLVNNIDARIIRLQPDGTTIGSPQVIKNSYVRKFSILNGKVYILEHNNTKNTLKIFNVDGTPFSCDPTGGPGSGTTGPARTTLSMKLKFHGIGSGGDSTNPNDSRLSNKNPLHQERTLNIQIVDEDNQIVATKLAPAFYNDATGEFISNVVIYEPLAEGDYIVKVKTNPYLRKLMPGFLSVKPGEKNNMNPTDLIAGDINGDNTLNVLDYNVLYDCGYGAINPLPMINRKSVFNNKNCLSHDERDNSDLNDNGLIDSSDYNLFIRELSVGFGH